MKRLRADASTGLSQYSSFDTKTLTVKALRKLGWCGCGVNDEAKQQGETCLCGTFVNMLLHSFIIFPFPETLIASCHGLQPLLVSSSSFSVSWVFSLPSPILCLLSHFLISCVVYIYIYIMQALSLVLPSSSSSSYSWTSSRLAPQLQPMESGLQVPLLS